MSSTLKRQRVLLVKSIKIELFDDEIRVLTRRRENSKDCSIEDLQGTLDALYILEGNNIGGRSKVHEIALSASIAAYEKFIEDWKNEK